MHRVLRINDRKNHMDIVNRTGKKNPLHETIEFFESTVETLHRISFCLEQRMLHNLHTLLLKGLRVTTLRVHFDQKTDTLSRFRRERESNMLNPSRGSRMACTDLDLHTGTQATASMGREQDKRLVTAFQMNIGETPPFNKK